MGEGRLRRRTRDRRVRSALPFRVRLVADRRAPWARIREGNVRERDDELMLRAIAARPRRAPPHRAVARGRLRARPRRRGRRRGRDRSVSRPVRTPRSRPCAPPASGPRARPRTARSSRATTTATRRRAPRRLIAAGCRAGRRRGRRSRRAGRGPRATRGCATRASRSQTGVGAAAAERDLAPYLHHRRTGRPFVVAKVALEPRRPRRRGRRLVAVDHVGRGAAPTRTSCAPTRRRSSSAPGTALADRPALTVRDVERRAGPTRRCACCSTRAAACPPTGRCSTPTLAPDARRHDRTAPRRARSTRGARRAPRSRSSRPARAAAASISTPRSRVLGREGVLAGAGRGRRRAARRASLDGGHAQRLVVVRRAGAARYRRRSPASRSPGPRTIADAPPLRARRRHPRRRRRAARARARDGSALMFTGIVEELGRVRAVAPNEGGARLEIDADDGARRREHRRVDRGQRLLPHGRRARRRVLGRRRGRSRRSARTNLGDLARRRSRQPRAAGAARRPPRRPPRAGPRRRDRRGARPRRRSPTGPSSSGSTRPPTCCATSCTRARSPSTASASPSPRCTTTGSRSRSSRTRSRSRRSARAPPARRVNLEVDLIAKYVERLLVSERSPT